MPGGGAVYYYDESGAGITIDAGPLELTFSLEGAESISAAPSPGALTVAGSLLGSVITGTVIDPGPLLLQTSLLGSKVVGAAPSPGPLGVAAAVLGSASISVSVSPGALTATLSLHGEYALPVFEELDEGFFIVGKIEDRVIA